MINTDGEPATGELPDRHASLTGSRPSAFTTGPKARTPADRLVARPHSGIPVSRAVRRSGGRGKSSRSRSGPPLRAERTWMRASLKFQGPSPVG